MPAVGDVTAVLQVEKKIGSLSHDEVDALRTLRIEMATVDGPRSSGPNKYPNGFFLADFFDFNYSGS